MKIGVPKEIKNNEYRVGLTPESVAQLIAHGHELIVETKAGVGIGVLDAHYQQVGAQIGKNADEIFQTAEMIVKVKEPLAPERKRLQKGQLLFTYLHLAADKTMTTELMESGATCIAYETITDHQNHLPLLTPMSQVAGRLAAEAGAYYLQKSQGGKGKLIGGVPGVPPAKVAILGGGVVGRNAARIAHGMGADVVIIDKNAQVMDAITVEFNGAVKTLYSSNFNLAATVRESDIVIGGVLIPGRSAPKLITRQMVASMQAGSVVVDVAIDQGGCIETSKPTTHDDPVYTEQGVVHYCVSNMPGAVPYTSTYALNNVTLDYTLALANQGWVKSMQDNPHFRKGLSIANYSLTCPHTALSLGLPHTPAEDILNSQS